MKLTCRIIPFALVWANCVCVWAEDQTAKLPDDGWWIRYSWNEKTEVRGELQEYTEKITCSFVGTATEDSEKCRWVEKKRDWSLGGKDRVSWVKFLVPEKDLIENEKPLERLKRAWVKSGDNDVRAMIIGKDIKPDSNLLRVFPGVWQNTERLEKERVVDYQKGRLTISEARTRTDKTSDTFEIAPGKNLDRTRIEESTVWFDQITSPVYAAASFRIKSYENDLLHYSKEIEMVIEDIGNDAQSKLPDNN